MEKDIENKLRLAAKRRGGIAYKFTSPGNSGVPDRIVILPGGHIGFVELKAKNGRLSKLQEMQIKRLRDLGARVFVLYEGESPEDVLDGISASPVSDGRHQTH